MIEQYLYSHLSGHADVAALVGSGDASKIYPYESVPPGTAPPFITWYEVSRNPVNSLGGTGSLFNSRFQFDMYADSALTLRSLRSVIITAMNVSNVYFTAMMLRGNDEGQEPNTLLFRYTMDYSIWHSD